MRPSSKNEFYKSVKQLDLKVRQDPQDIEQVDRLLAYILCYPSIEEAKVHHRANNIGTNDLLVKQKQIQTQVRQNEIKNIQVCACCGVLSQNEELSYFINLEDLNLGVGVYLFFKNYFFHAIVFLLMFFIYSLFSLITNIKIFNQQNGTGVLCFVTNNCGIATIGAGSKVINQNDYKNHFSQIQSWLGIAFVIVWGLMYAIKTFVEDRFVIGLSERRISASDFTLMLTHIPRSYFLDANQKTMEELPLKEKKKMNEGNRKYQQRQTNYSYLSIEEITKKFNRELMDYGRKMNSLVSYEVVKINIAKPLYQSSEQDKELQKKAEQQLNQRLNVFRNWIKQRQNSTKFSVPIQKREQRYNEYMNYYANEFDKNAKREVDYADDNVVFVTMRSSQAMREIVQKNPLPSIYNLWNCCRKNDFPIPGVKVRKAPQPEEVKWLNVGFPIQRKRKRRLFTWLVTILLFAASLGISIGISFINQNKINTGVSFGISVVVSAVNIGMQMSMMYISYFQNQYISSRQQTNIALKIGIAQLVNSIGVPIIVTIISQRNVSAEMQTRTWLKSGGLVDTVFYVAALNILVPVVIFFDPWEIYLRFWRWYYSKPSQRLYIHTQKSFNKHFGNYYFDIGYEYAYLIKTTIYTAFFVCMQPIIAVFAPIGLILYYLATKRNLLYHFQRPSFHFDTINKTVDFMLYFSLIAFGFGNLLVNNFIREQLGFESNGTLLTNWIIVMIGTGFLLVLPLRIFYCCIPRPTLAQHDYLEKKVLLLTDYDRSNPETKESAVYQFKQYIDKLDEAHRLPNEAQFIKLQVNNQIENKEQQKHSRSFIASHIKSSHNIPVPVPETEQTHEPIYNNNIDDYKKIAESFGQKEQNMQPGANSNDSLRGNF